MEYINIVSVVIAFCAFVTSVFASYTAHKMRQVSDGMFKLERNRFEGERREQASRVYAIAYKPPTGGLWGLYVVNDSNKPVYDVQIKSQWVDGSNRPNPDLKLMMLPPGRFIISPCEKWWDNPKFFHPDHHTGELLTYFGNNGKKMVTYTRFTDSDGTQWEREDGVTLQPVGGCCLIAA